MIMNGLVDMITKVNSAVNSFVWGIPMLIMLVGTGILMTVLTKFFQLSHIGHWWKNTIGGIFSDGQKRQGYLTVSVSVYGPRRHHRHG